MNKDTIAKNSTLALTKMAAQKEKDGATIPGDDIIASIDDILSVTTGFELFGTATKTYRHPTDPNSGAYCTVPVKYDFPDKDTRFRAEKYLREKCNIHCTTPYHSTLRECIKQLVEKMKKEFPKNQIRVTIDTGKMWFNVSRREPGSKEDPKPWIRCQSVPVPEEALDTETKKIPQGFKITWKTGTASAASGTGRAASVSDGTVTANSDKGVAVADAGSGTGTGTGSGTDSSDSEDMETVDHSPAL
jgi:hypothetical protein